MNENPTPPDLGDAATAPFVHASEPGPLPLDAEGYRRELENRTPGDQSKVIRPGDGDPEAQQIHDEVIGGQAGEPQPPLPPAPQE